MSADTMPCGCEGHADNEELCRYPALEEAARCAAGSIDSLIHTLQLPLPAHIHLEGVRGTLPEILRKLRAALPED